MHYNPVATKIKVILHTKNLTQEEFAEFYSAIRTLKEYSVNFFNPYTGQKQTANCYRGDRKITAKWNRTDKGILYNPFSVSLIEL